jgi:asparagine synthase (glutamine-hydrolysing)
MCGICGLVQIDGDPRRLGSPHVVDRMTDRLTHRGPNDRGVFSAPGIALGARRLSIVDIAGGHQPMANEDGTVVAVQNGELYNHEALRADLERAGHRFETRCDTEVLPHLYEQHDLDFPAHLRGKFAIAIWDDRRKRAVLVRDRLGVKPLYYAVCDDVVVFASELKSVLASGLVPTHLDYEAIDVFLRLGFFPYPTTPLSAVRKLAPGSSLVAGDGSISEHVYWRYPEPRVTEPGVSIEDWGERLIAKLDEAVRLRLMSDVPLGSMLSGGLDSSVVTALMARHSSNPVKTFSVGFAGDSSSELADARLVSAALGTEHHELELEHDDTIDIAELVWAMDEPLADLSALGMLALSELASRHVTVALSGQGADELLGGYSRHWIASMTERWSRLPGPLKAGGQALAARGPAKLRRAAHQLAAEDAGQLFLRMRGTLGDAERARLVRGPLGELDGLAAAQIVADRLGSLDSDALSSVLYVDAQLGLVDDMLQYFDRTSMARSLEVRVPFLDHELVELCARIPPRLKVDGRTTKAVLKKAARGLVPDRIIDKPKIGFFNDSLDRWFASTTSASVSDYLLAPSPRYATMLDRGEVERIVKSGTGGRTLLAILMLEVWLSSFVPRATSAPEPERERVPVEL